MKKSFIFIVLISVSLLVSCGTKPNTQVEGDKNNNIISNKTEENNKSNENSNSTENSDLKKDNEESKKQFYLDKYYNLEKELQDSLKVKYNGTTIEMREASSIEYESWDKLLNEIYGVLQGQLSATEMEKLKEKQIAWIDIRDSKAKEEAKKVEGGTMEPLAYTSSLRQSTKERCYELIVNYMK